MNIRCNELLENFKNREEEKEKQLQALKKKRAQFFIDCLGALFFFIGLIILYSLCK